MKNSKTRKTYKHHFTGKIRIFPGDPTGSPDDFFYALSPQYLFGHAGFLNLFKGGLSFYY